MSKSKNLNISELAAALGKLDVCELRRIENAIVIGIAGIVGHVREDLSVHLSIKRLSAQAKQTAVDLFDAGVLGSSGADGALYVARLPIGTEVKDLRTALGIRGATR